MQRSTSAYDPTTSSDERHSWSAEDPASASTRCRREAAWSSVTSRDVASRRQKVGIWQQFGQIRAEGDSRTRHMQAISGAPGLDRTADTRLRKPAEGVRAVVARGRLCCTVHGSGGSRCWAVFGRDGLWWRVSSAMRRQRSQPPTRGIMHAGATSCSVTGR